MRAPAHEGLETDGRRNARLGGMLALVLLALYAIAITGVIMLN
jgi:hypothetical protein